MEAPLSERLMEGCVPICQEFDDWAVVVIQPDQVHAGGAEGLMKLTVFAEPIKEE